MNDFSLDQRLAADTHPIIDNDDYYLGLHKNALVPWLIFVPKTQHVELFDCEPEFRQRIQSTIDNLAIFARKYFAAEKMNTAALGNVVSQLHIHIIARKKDDFAWPDPVWGKSECSAYADCEKDAIIAAVKAYLQQQI